MTHNADDTDAKATVEQDTMWSARLSKASHTDLARLYRFAPPGHPVFIRGSALHAQFEEAWKKYGGWNSQLSKEVGW